MIRDKQLNRRDLVAELVRQRGQAAIITGLGSPTYDCAVAGDSSLNFYLWGGMGGAAMLGFGVALAKPDRRVVVLTTDGEILMGVGSFATIASQQPRNLAILVLDNEAFGETGSQPGLTSFGVDIAAMAAGAGIKRAMTVRTPQEREALLRAVLHDEGPVVAVAKVELSDDPVALPSRDGESLHYRFREAVMSAS